MPLVPLQEPVKVKVTDPGRRRALVGATFKVGAGGGAVIWVVTVLLIWPRASLA